MNIDKKLTKQVNNLSKKMSLQTQFKTLADGLILISSGSSFHNLGATAENKRHVFFLQKPNFKFYH